MPSLQRSRAHYQRPFRAQVSLYGHPIFLGYFATLKEADSAEDSYRRKYLRELEQEGLAEKGYHGRTARQLRRKLGISAH